MSSFDLMREAKSVLKTFKWHAISPYLLFIALFSAVNAAAVAILPMADIARGIPVSLTTAQNVFRIFYTIFNAVLIPLVLFGIYRVYLVFSGMQRPAFSVLFDGLVNCIRVWILLFLKTVLVAIGLLMLVIPGLFFYYNTAVANFVFSDDEDMLPWSAIPKSFQLMKGNCFRLLKLQLSFLGWFLLVIITLGLALIYVGPYYMTALSLFYRQIKEEKEKEAVAQRK